MSGKNVEGRRLVSVTRPGDGVVEIVDTSNGATTAIPLSHFDLVTQVISDLFFVSVDAAGDEASNQTISDEAPAAANTSAGQPVSDEAPAESAPAPSSAPKKPGRPRKNAPQPETQEAAPKKPRGRPKKAENSKAPTPGAERASTEPVAQSETTTDTKAQAYTKDKTGAEAKGSRKRADAKASTAPAAKKDKAPAKQQAKAPSEKSAPAAQGTGLAQNIEGIGFQLELDSSQAFYDIKLPDGRVIGRAVMGPDNKRVTVEPAKGFDYEPSSHSTILAAQARISVVVMDLS